MFYAGQLLPARLKRDADLDDDLTAWFEAWLDETPCGEGTDDTYAALRVIAIPRADGRRLLLLVPQGPVVRGANPLYGETFEMSPDCGCFAQPTLPCA